MTTKHPLLDPSTFEHDDVTVAFGAKRQDSTGWVVLSERLVARVVALGTAYSQHLTPLIQVHGDVELNAKQCAALVEELRFLGSVVDDPALDHAIAKLLPVIESVARSANGMLAISGN